MTLNGKCINEILRKREQELIEEGMKEGIKEGMKESGEKIARNMIQKGYSIDQIAELTKLDMDSIHQLILEK